MNAQKTENLALLLIAGLLALAIYIILYHPEWLLWIITYKG
jgi:hypothetical protein